MKPQAPRGAGETKSLVSKLLLALWVVFLLQQGYVLLRSAEEVPYSQFKSWLAEDRLVEVSVSEGLVAGRAKADKPGQADRTFRTVRVADPQLVADLEKHHVKFAGVVTTSFWQTATWLLPLVALLLLFGFLSRGGRERGLLGIGQAKARLYVEKEIPVRFTDVAGVDESVEELKEVVEFLKTPEKFTRIGARIPKGVLLVGPPGTGKTLLAKAVAGEAGVPFFSISGSEFVEMFVGVGAARVRDLFDQAKAKAPCMIFVDELDALGKARGMGPMAHEEREQTLNQLLVEMDGFDPRVGVVLMAATNRPEILDPALLRAGRFDRHVLVDRPDRIGRLAILSIHVRPVTLGPDVDLERVAAMTPGMVGADLANVVNEAALLAVRHGRDRVGQKELEEAVERILAGLEKKSRILTRAERERVAHHEVGHALLGLLLPGADPVQKVSIVPRGIAALGYTLQTPTEDRFLLSKTELLTKIAVLMGGTVAEDMIFGEGSTGAQDDLQKATAIAKSMVRDYGMSEGLGPVAASSGAPLFDSSVREPERRGDYADATAQVIDREVRGILERQRTLARRILAGVEPALRDGARLLLEKEVLAGEELRVLLAARNGGAAPVPSELVPETVTR